MTGMVGQSSIVRAAAVVVAVVFAVASVAADVAMKTVDTGLGFSLSVPETWTKGQPSKNNKFVIGSSDEDFAVVVSDFGPAQTDTAQALAIYRESFSKSGLAPQTESEMTVGGKTVKRFVLRFESPDGPGHGEAVLVQVADEMYAVLVVTPVATAETRRTTIAKIFESIAIK